MLVRKCDICDRIIGDDEAVYMVDIAKAAIPKGTEVRYKTHETSMEICYDCKQAMFHALTERMTKYVLMGKEDNEE